MTFPESPPPWLLTGHVSLRSPEHLKFDVTASPKQAPSLALSWGNLRAEDTAGVVGQSPLCWNHRMHMAKRQRCHETPEKPQGHGSPQSNMSSVAPQSLPAMDCVPWLSWLPGHGDTCLPRGLGPAIPSARNPLPPDVQGAQTLPSREAAITTLF